MLSMTVSTYVPQASLFSPYADVEQYAYLSHFYANALTAFLDPDLSISQLSADHFTALRHLPSFQA